jgi:hypothetical protein
LPQSINIVVGDANRAKGVLRARLLQKRSQGIDI